MAFTQTRTFSIFTAGESAPNVNDFLNIDELESGLLIVNQQGNIALKVAQLGGRIMLDETLETPTLRFNRASVATQFGAMIEDEGFVPHDNQASRRMSIVQGDYFGPGSELKIA